MSNTETRRFPVQERRFDFTGIIQERRLNGRIDSDPKPVKTSLRTEGLTAWYEKDKPPVIQNVTLHFPEKYITAIIGPSGCGKSTVLRCLNRMHELREGAGVSGSVYLGDDNIYDPNTDPVKVRRIIGMNFQQPNPFPFMNIVDNVVAGLSLNGPLIIGKMNWTEKLDIAEPVLEQVTLWDEVKDDLKKSGAKLSVGQQQRLCIARALAVKPEVLLMDEPCSSLDPPNAYKIEELMFDLKRKYTLVIVTHNMQQAARIADFTAFMAADSSRGIPGTIIEHRQTGQIFTNPKDQRTEDYITGRFG